MGGSFGVLLWFGEGHGVSRNFCAKKSSGFGTEEFGICDIRSLKSVGGSFSLGAREGASSPRGFLMQAYYIVFSRLFL